MNDRCDETARAICCTLISCGASMETETERRVLAHRAYDVARKMEQSRELFLSVERARAEEQERAEREEAEQARAARWGTFRAWIRGPWLTWLLFGAPWHRPR